MAAPRDIWLLLFPGFQSLDVTGPLEVFTGANLIAERAGRCGYRTTIVGPGRGPVSSSSGLNVVPDRGLGAVRRRIDTLVVAGGRGTREALASRALIGFTARASARARRTASVCTGAFLLAEAGLLDGRRATTHWAWCDALRKRHPAIEVDPDPIYVRDGRVITSAGVTAGIDMALALVEDDLGRQVALDTARELVMFVRRPGGQSQFSAQLASQLAERSPVRAAQELVTREPGRDLSVAALAEHAGMSARNFARVFRREVGMTPAAYVERARTEVARRLLEDTGYGLEDVAAAAGFGSVETLRRAFGRQLSVSPRDYRRRFRAA